MQVKYQEDYLKDLLNDEDSYDNIYRQEHMIQSGGNIDSNNNTDINNALQILIDNIDKWTIKKRYKIDKDVHSKESQEKGGVNKKKKCLLKKKRQTNKKIKKIIYFLKFYFFLFIIKYEKK